MHLSHPVWDIGWQGGIVGVGGGLYDPAAPRPDEDFWKDLIQGMYTLSISLATAAY